MRTRTVIAVWIVLACRAERAPTAPRPGPAPTAAWQWEHPSPGGTWVRGFASAGATTIAVGARGMVLRSDDRGVSWKRLDSGTDDDLVAVAATGTVFVAVGERGRVVRIDGGRATASSVATSHDLLAVAGTPDRIVVLGEDTELFESTDAARTFARRPVRQIDHPTSIAFAAPGTLIIGARSGLWSLATGATAATHVAAEPIHRLAVSPEGTLYAFAGAHLHMPSEQACGSCVGVSAETLALVRSRDGVRWEIRSLLDPSKTTFSGHRASIPPPPSDLASWRAPSLGWGALPPPPSPPPPPPPPKPGAKITIDWSVPFEFQIQFDMLERDRGLVVGPRGEVVLANSKVIFVSADGGTTFTERTTPGSTLGRTDGPLLAGGANGLLATSSDHGATWTTRSQNLSPETGYDRPWFRGLAIAPGGAAIAVGDRGTLLVRDSKGAWRRTQLDTKIDMHAAAWLDDRTVILVGKYGQIQRSRDGGATFEFRPTDQLAHFDFVIASGNEVFAAASDRMVISRDAGETWRSMKLPLADLRSFREAPNGDLFAVGKVVLRSRDRGESWTQLALPRDARPADLWASRGRIVLVGDDGVIGRSDDDGRTWIKVPSPLDRLARIWGHGDELVALRFEYPDSGSQQLARSLDAGQTWRIEQSPTSDPLVAIASAGRAVYGLTGTGAIVRRSLPATTTPSITPSSRSGPRPEAPAKPRAATTTPMPPFTSYRSESGHATDSAVMPDGDVVVVGCETGAIEFDPSAAGETRDDVPSTFVTRIDRATRVAKWTRRGVSPCRGYDAGSPRVTVTGSGDVWVAAVGWGLTARYNEREHELPTILLRLDSAGTTKAERKLADGTRVLALGPGTGAGVVVGAHAWKATTPYVAVLDDRGVETWHRDLPWGAGSTVESLAVDGAKLWVSGTRHGDCAKALGAVGQVSEVRLSDGRVEQTTEIAHKGVNVDDVHVAPVSGRPVIAFGVARCVDQPWPASLSELVPREISGVVILASARGKPWRSVIGHDDHTSVSGLAVRGDRLALGLEIHGGAINFGKEVWIAASYDLAAVLVIDAADGKTRRAEGVSGAAGSSDGRVRLEQVRATPTGFVAVGMVRGEPRHPNASAALALADGADTPFVWHLAP